VNEDITAYPDLLSTYEGGFYVEPGFYSSVRGFAGEPETYTIVGLYSRENAWQDGSLYAFTPNTIFIPKASTEAPMVMSEEGLFRSYVLENGLKLGDTITLRSYAYDPNVNEDITAYPDLLSTYEGGFYVEPGFYSSVRGFAGEPETYTIVGLYSRENAWQDGSLYAFTPNTIFIPKASTEAPMVMSEEGLFRSYVLENGTAEAFDALVKEAGYNGLFVYYDQGYEQVKDGLAAYESVSGQALYVGIAAALGILLLYILLFPLRQRRHLTVMSTLGATRGQRLAHLAAYNLGMLLPGVALGTLVGALVWKRVTAELLASVDALLPLHLELWRILMISGALLLFAAVIVFLCGLTQTREGSYMRRKD